MKLSYVYQKEPGVMKRYAFCGVYKIDYYEGKAHIFFDDGMSTAEIRLDSFIVEREEDEGDGE